MEERDRHWRRRAVVALGLLVSVACAYLAVRDVHARKAWEAARATDAAWFVPALGAMVAAFFLRVERWRAMFEPSRRPAFRPTARALYLGYLFNNLLPLRAGEPLRIVALSRRARVSLTEATATVVVERFFDTLSLVVLLLVCTPWLPELTWIRAAAVLCAVLVVAGLAAALVLARFRERPLSFLVRQLSRLPGLDAERLLTSPRNALHGLVALRRVRAALLGFGLTTLSWLVLGIGFWLVAVAFDLSVSPLAGLLVVIAVGLGMILPSSPAAVGVFEGATVLALTAYGVDESVALSCALVLHALNVLPFYVLAPVLLRGDALSRLRRDEARSTGEAVVPPAPSR